MLSSARPRPTFVSDDGKAQRGATAESKLPPIGRAGSAQGVSAPGKAGGRPGSRVSAKGNAGGALSKGTGGGAGGGGGAAAAARGVPSALNTKKNAVWLRVLRQRAQGRELVRTHGDTLGGMKELLKALALQASTPGGMSDPVGLTSKGVVAADTPDVEPSWMCAEEVVHLANEKAIEGGATAAPQSETNQFFREALRLVCAADDDMDELLEEDCLGIFTPHPSGAGDGGEGGGGGARSLPGASSRQRTGAVANASARPSSSSNNNISGRKRAASAASTGGGHSWKQGTDYFQSFPELRPSLCAVLLNNVAVQMQMAGRPQTEVLYVLMRALVKSKGVMCSGLLYNLSVTYAAMGQLEEAFDVLSRCMELCTLYLKVDPRRETETAVEAAELADTYSTFVVAIAAHLIACHHLAASLSAHMCEAFPESTTSSAEAEVQHCQQAVECATAYLPSVHPLHRRCGARLAAARARPGSAESPPNLSGWDWGSRPSSSAPVPPPQLPLMPLHMEFVFSSSPVISEAPAVATLTEGEFWQQLNDGSVGPAFIVTVTAATNKDPPSAATAAAPKPPFTAVMLSRLLQLWGRVKLPLRIRAFLKKLARQLAKVRRKREAAAAAAAAAATEAARNRGKGAAAKASPPRQKTSSRAGGRSRTPSPQLPVTPNDERLPASSPGLALADGAAVSEPVAPPLIITEIPRAAFNRYKSLKHNALHFLDDIATSMAEDSDSETEITFPKGASSRLGVNRATASATALSLSAQAASYDWESAQCRRRKLSTLYYSAVEEDASGGGDAQGSESRPAVSFSGAASAKAAHHKTGGHEGSAKGGANLSAGDASAAAGVMRRLTVMLPSEQMRTMDTELLRYSRLLVDPVPEIRYAAARAIQRRWRCCMARLRRLRKVAQIEEWLAKSEAAAVILRAYWNYRACAPAKEELHELQAEHQRMLRATLIQQYLREKQSVEEWGHRCVALHERLLAEKAQRELEEASAVMMQSGWRMHRTRSAYKQMQRAALMMQCAVRSHQARKETTHRRVLRRLAYEEFLRRNRGSIIYMQRWYRACKARHAVAGLLESKQEAVARYLEAQEAEFLDAMGIWGEDLDQAGRAMEQMLAVLHGAKARREMYRRHVAMERIRGFLARWALGKRGGQLLERLRTERREDLRMRRRREEVLDATLRIQAATRRWLKRHHLATRYAVDALLHDSALQIQSAYRAYRRRLAKGTAEECRAQANLNREAERVLRLREYSATKVQATYRMHRTRRQNAEFLQFMLVDRHTMARRIQHRWRIFLARRVAEQRRSLLAEIACHRQREAYQRVSVVRMQSVARMFLVRRRRVPRADSASSSSSPSPLPMMWYTPYQRFAAARRIQTAWRVCAARSYCRQVRLATAYYVKEKTTLESLHAYATVIQKMVRARLLGPGRAPTKRRSPQCEPSPRALQPHPPTKPARPADDEGAATSINSGARIRSRLRGSTGMMSTHSPTAPVHVHAASNPSLMCAERLLGERTRSREGREGATAPYAATLPSRLSTSAKSDAVSDAAPADNAQPQQKHHAAATLIQKVWRGYWTRCAFEFYYEEVEVDEDQSAPNEVEEAEESESESESEEVDRTDQSTFPSLGPVVRTSPHATSFSLSSAQPHKQSPASGDLPSTASQRSEEVTQPLEVLTTTLMTTRTTTTTTRTTTTTTMMMTSTTSATALEGHTAPPSLTTRAAPLVTTSGDLPLLTSCTPEHHAAATLIQKVWRGYWTRCAFEFYYEEVEVDEEESSAGHDRHGSHDSNASP